MQAVFEALLKQRPNDRMYTVLFIMRSENKNNVLNPIIIIILSIISYR